MELLPDCNEDPKDGLLHKCISKCCVNAYRSSALPLTRSPGCFWLSCGATSRQGERVSTQPTFPDNLRVAGRFLEGLVAEQADQQCERS
jgi:hypothetical protein